MLPSGLYGRFSLFKSHSKTLRRLRIIDRRYRPVERTNITLKLRKPGECSIQSVNLIN